MISGRFFPKLPCKINWRRDFFRRVRNTVNPLSNFMPCRSSQENLMSETGVCLLPPVCSFYGGRATTGGRCRMGLSCCVSEFNWFNSISFYRYSFLNALAIFTIKMRFPTADSWSRSTTRTGNRHLLSIRKAVAI